MKKYVVGGYVRDLLMSRKPSDKDYVVVGSSPEEMSALGYKQVGSEFPVFLHPETGDEYALARIERKTGDKHTDFKFDFSPDVTLKQDCVRRDFTCNALAMDEDTGEVIDYFGGREDIKNKIIRVVDEVHFKEDPLRILRAYRFAAVLGFDIEPKTKEILKSMIDNGMLEYLTCERVWGEVEKVLRPGVDSVRFFEGLAEAGGLNFWFFELQRLLNTPEQIKYHASGNSFRHTMCALDRVKDDDSLIKWAVLNHDLGKADTPDNILPHHTGHEERGVPLVGNVCKRLRVSNKYKLFAVMFCREHMKLFKFNDMDLSEKYSFVKTISRNFSDKEYLEKILRCFYADFYGEKVMSEHRNTEDFGAICENVWGVFDIVREAKEKLSQEILNDLSEKQGREFGIAYDEKIQEYIADKLM